MFIWRGFIQACSGQNVHLLTSVAPLFYHTTSQVVIDENDTNTTLTSHRLTPDLPSHGPLARYVNCGLRMCRECRERFPHQRLQRKPLVSDPGLHHGTCVMHWPWCMSGSLTRDGGENVHGIPGTCATRNFTYLSRGPPPQTTPKQRTPSTMRTWVLTYSSRLLGQNCS